MAAFSFHHHSPFLVPDSGYVPNTSYKLCGLLEEEIINTTSCFSLIHPSNSTQASPLHARIHGNIKFPLTYVEPSVTGKQYTYSSSMVAELETGDQVTQVVTHLEKKRKTMGRKVARERKCKKEKKCDNGISRNGGEKKLKAERNDKEKSPEEVPTGYIHVRARRGQATDSHSLAERVRREKISERMRLLQSLVPGCDKITGKTLILDEIINYVQSLQNQVEFLAMKNASDYPVLSDIHTNKPASEGFCNLETPLPSLPQLDSIQLRTTVNETAPSSNSSLLQQDEISNFLSQDDGEIFGDMDDQIQKLANCYEFSNLCSF